MDTAQHPPLPTGSRIVLDEQPGRLTIEIPPRGVLQASAGLVFFGALWLMFVGSFTALIIFAGLGLLGNRMPILVALGALAFLSIFWLVGLGLLAFAINLGRRQFIISIFGDRLVIVRSGGIGKPTEFEWAGADLARVQVGRTDYSLNHQRLAELQIFTRKWHKCGLLAGYPKAELDWLAARLCAQFDLQPQETKKVVLADVDRPPVATQVVYQPVDDGFTLSIPPAGLWRGSLTVFPIGLAWTACVVVGTVLLALFIPDVGTFPLLWLILAGNLLVGIAIIVFGYYLGTRQAEIAVAGGRMLVIHRGLRANWKREWSRDELAAVRAGDSSAKVNNQPLVQLQIVPRTGAAVTLLTGRDREELGWIATLIRRSLNLPADKVPVPGA